MSTTEQAVGPGSPPGPHLPTCRASTLPFSFSNAGVILYNKHILAYSGFPYPISLTLWHMLFCASLAVGLVRSGRVAAVGMDRGTYLRAIVPIGGLLLLLGWTCLAVAALGFTPDRGASMRP